MNNPFVSVILPVYNAAPWLHRCLDSLVYQTLEEIEVIVADNCSDDETPDIVAAYHSQFGDKVRYFRLSTFSAGPGAGRNLGLANATAKYIAFIDSDDYFAYDALKKMFLKAVSGNYDMVYVSNYNVLDNKLTHTRMLKWGTKEEILVTGSMVFWNKLTHRRLFEQVGTVPEGMVFEDLAYCTALVSYAQNIGYINEPLYY
jgi:glycosyltransferase involved in cell wall biosynthesis